MARSARRYRLPIAVAAAVLLTGLVPAGAASAAPPVSSDPGVLLTWNAIAWRTVSVSSSGTPTPAPIAMLYLGFVSTAVYNAVVTIEGGGEATLPQPRAHAMASSDVAAATAAYDVLRTYFSHAAGALDTDYANFLAGVPDGVGRVHGLRVGHDAAKALIASRVGDGRDAIVPPPAPRTDGATWVPTGSGDFQVPWLGFVRPLLLDSATQFPLDGPDALTSAAYAADFDEVKAMGGDAATGSDRSTLQTETARFFSDNPVRQYQDAMRLRAQEHAMDILATARMFGAANSSGADALIACWRGKYDFNFWRPVTAIRQAATDGNDATTPNGTWTPLLTTPPYPDSPSGHACVTSSVARALEHQFGAGNLDLAITSNVTGTTRDYDGAQAWLEDEMNARIWLGIHFRDAMDDARTLGQQVADHDAASFDPAG